MQEGPRIKKCPIVIQFLGTYVIVMRVTSKGMDVDVLVEIIERGF